MIDNNNKMNMSEESYRNVKFLCNGNMGCLETLFDLCTMFDIPEQIYVSKYFSCRSFAMLQSTIERFSIDYRKT